MSDERHTAETFRLVQEGEQYVNSEGKNPVVLFGQSQIGKSATIASLMGISFRFNEERDLVMAELPNSPDAYPAVAPRTTEG
jgi:hypothetical protein